MLSEAKTILTQGETSPVIWLQNQHDLFQKVKEQLEFASKNIFLLDSNRLYYSDIEKWPNLDETHDDNLSINILSNDLKSKIAGIEELIGKNAAKLDSEFINLFLQVVEEKKATSSEVHTEFTEFVRKFKMSSKYFTTRTIDYDFPQNIPDEAINLFSIFCKILNDRYSERFKFAQSAKLFEKRLNSLLEDEKDLRVTPKGIEVYQRNDQIPIEKLSSGEQHQIIISYGLIFLAHNNSIILIDEPEISLHPTWQVQFATSMLEINKEKKHQFIVATHSPNIVGHEYDRIKPLFDHEESDELD